MPAIWTQGPQQVFCMGKEQSQTRHLQSKPRPLSVCAAAAEQAETGTPGAASKHAQASPANTGPAPGNAPVQAQHGTTRHAQAGPGV